MRFNELSSDTCSFFVICIQICLWLYLFKVITFNRPYGLESECKMTRGNRYIELFKEFFIRGRVLPLFLQRGTTTLFWGTTQSQRHAVSVQPSDEVPPCSRCIPLRRPKPPIAANWLHATPTALETSLPLSQTSCGDPGQRARSPAGWRQHAAEAGMAWRQCFARAAIEFYPAGLQKCKGWSWRHFFARLSAELNPHPHPPHPRFPLVLGPQPGEVWTVCWWSRRYL